MLPDELIRQLKEMRREIDKIKTFDIPKKSEQDNRYLKLDASNGPLTGPLASSVATGTAPFDVASTTMNLNLNAEMLGGFRASELPISFTKINDLEIGSLITKGSPHENYALLSLGATITSSPPYASTPDSIIDGNDATQWGDYDHQTPWFRVDLGSPRSIDSFRMYQYIWSRTWRYTIKYSSDDATWTLAYTKSTLVSEFSDNFPQSIVARYWLVEGIDNNWVNAAWSVSTFELKSNSDQSVVALPIGSTGQVLTVVSGIPSWAASSPSSYPAQNANKILAGPTTGADAAPAFRVLVSADIPAHNILSSSHGDTLTGSVLDGMLIIGNVTPKWSALAISVPAANVRNVLGIDNGELRPSWKAALDATNPATLTAAGAAAAGTSLVFSHRDHVHAITSSSNPGAAASILASDAAGLLTLAGLTVSGGLNVGTATGAGAGDVKASGNLSIAGIISGRIKTTQVSDSSGYENVTHTISTPAFMYYFEKIDTWGNASSTTTINITGLVDENGSLCYIKSLCSSLAAGNQVMDIKINGNLVCSNMSAEGQTYITKWWLVICIGGAWRAHVI